MGLSSRDIHLFLQHPLCFFQTSSPWPFFTSGHRNLCVGCPSDSWRLEVETKDLQMKGLTVRQGQFPGFVTFIISRTLGFRHYTTVL